MRPTFGCGLRRYLMEPNTLATRALDPARRSPRALDRVGAAHRRCGQVTVEPGDDPALVLITIALRARARRPPGNCSSTRSTWSDGAMPLPTPILDDRSYEQLRDELIAPHPRLHPGVDRPQPERSRHHPAGAVRVPGREPALPLQPDPRRRPGSRSSTCCRSRCGRRTPATGAGRASTTRPRRAAPLRPDSARAAARRRRAVRRPSTR